MGKYLKENLKPYSLEYAGDKDLKKYFGKLALGYLSLIKMHKESGHLPSLKNSSPELTAKNIAETGQADWSNIVRHCLAVAGAVDAVAKTLELSEEERKILIQAAILHDFDKRIQITAFKQDPQKSRETYYALLKAGEDILTEHNVDPKVVAIIKGIGHHHAKEVLAGTMPELQRILYYVDNITEGTNLVPLQKKLDGMKKRYPILYEAGEYNDWISSSEKIQAELAERMGLEDPSKLPEFLTKKVKELSTKNNE